MYPSDIAEESMEAQPVGRKRRAGS